MIGMDDLNTILVHSNSQFALYSSRFDYQFDCK